MLESATSLFSSTLMFFASGAIGALVCARHHDLCRRVTHGFVFGGSVLIFGLSILGLFGGRFELLLPGILPFAGGLALGLDRLSAFFLLIIATGVAPSALYAISYTRHYPQKQSSMGFMLNIFVPAMMLVVLARNVLTFLLFWEAMSLASYFLVMTESEHEETCKAGWLYLVMMHAGLACLLIGFLAMSQASGTFDMSEWARSASGIDMGMRNLVFLVMAAGFLSKAGAIPFHVWLPRAHPAAPSPVSAVTAGGVVKIRGFGSLPHAVEM